MRLYKSPAICVRFAPFSNTAIVFWTMHYFSILLGRALGGTPCSGICAVSLGAMGPRSFSAHVHLETLFFRSEAIRCQVSSMLVFGTPQV